MDSNFQKFVANLEQSFNSIDSILENHNFDKNMQFPDLMEMAASQNNWDESQKRMYDPVIRLYIKTHEKYDMVRGAHGGITLRQSREKKLADKAAKSASKTMKEQLKAQIKADIESKISQPAQTNDMQVPLNEEEDLEE